MNAKVVIEQRTLRGSLQDFVLQKVATVYIRDGEYRVLAPPRAVGDALDWVGHFVVRRPDPESFNSEIAVEDGAHQVLAIRLVKEELEKTKDAANRPVGPSTLPRTAKTAEILRWVAANPNVPFDPTRVVSLSTGHTSDREWQAVTDHMEELMQGGYITKLKQDSAGATYWTVTSRGIAYLGALESSELREGAMAEDGKGPPVLVGGWERLEPLGKGGQGHVYLVRKRSRFDERNDALKDMCSNPWGTYSATEMTVRINSFLTSLSKFMRPDLPSELGALKVFNIADGDGKAEAIGRLRNEIAVLQQNRPGLIRLLAANEAERWIVTEYMPGGTIHDHPFTYKGNALHGLTAFRSVVSTVASLHKEKPPIIHRDIKPANVFISNDQLVLGDLGIVYLDSGSERLTLTHERVGSRTYMPSWGDIGGRLKNVEPNFDVYMLGKLLWCMVAGRLKLPLWYHRREAYDVTKLFPNDPGMHFINRILDRCVVEEPEKCLGSALELLEVVDENIAALKLGGQLVADDIPRHCRVCGRGLYRKVKTDPYVTGEHTINMTMSGKPIPVQMFMCDQCLHVEFFGVFPG